MRLACLEAVAQLLAEVGEEEHAYALEVELESHLHTVAVVDN